MGSAFIKQKQNGEKMQNHKNSKERLNVRIYAEDKALKSNFARLRREEKGDRDIAQYRL